MFLTKKSLWKIIISALCYFILGSFSIICGFLFFNKILLLLGLAIYLFIFILVAFGRYAEGKAKIINLGNELIRKKLKPNEFIKEYDRMMNSNEFLIKKPSPEVIQLLVVAYDLLDDKANALANADLMLSISKEKKKTFAKLIKTSLLYSYQMTKEAESLFFEAQNSKPNYMCQYLIDTIMKSDRAMAIGDLKSAEMYSLKMLGQTFPKLDDLGKLLNNFRLAEIYHKLGDVSKAIDHYNYCVENGGETAIKTAALSSLEALK